MTASTAKAPVGLSVSERALYDHLEHHLQAESGMIDLYDTLASTGHPYITFLADLIGEDEARHHRLFEEWMNSLRSMGTLADAKDGLPTLDRIPTTPETLALVDRLLEFEKADLAAVKQLKKDIADMADTTVWGALLETLIADTEKHIGILKFIRKRLRANR